MSIKYIYKKGYGKYFPIYGLYNNYTNTIKITDGFFTKVYKVKVPDILKILELDNLNNIGAVEVNKIKPNNKDQKLFMQSEAGLTYGFDLKGDLRFLMMSNIGSHIVSAKNGKIEYVNGTINNMGYVEQIFNNCNICHHDRISFGDNQYLLLGVDKNYNESLIQVYNKNNKKIKTYNFANLLLNYVDNNMLKKGVNKFKSKQYKQDWLHLNSLVYDENTKILYVSSQRTGIYAVKFIRGEMKLAWYMPANNPKWSDVSKAIASSKKMQQYLVNDDSPFQGTHALMLRDGSNKNQVILSVMDDKFDLKKGTIDYPRYVTYSINHQNDKWIAKKIDDFTIDVKFHANNQSDIDIINENMYLLHFVGRVDNKTTSLTYLINSKTKEVLYKAYTNNAVFYRSDYVSPYPTDNNNPIEYNEILGK